MGIIFPTDILGIGIQSLTVILKTNTLSYATLLSLDELIYTESWKKWMEEGQETEILDCKNSEL